jgi:hypothetical protein
MALVEHGIEKADQNIMTLFGAKDFFESVVGFRIYEAHSFLLAISISIMVWMGATLVPPALEEVEVQSGDVAIAAPEVIAEVVAEVTDEVTEAETEE